MCNPDESKPPPPRSSNSKTKTINAVTTFYNLPCELANTTRREICICYRNSEAGPTTLGCI
jgi:hypothetical protein